MPRFDHPGSAVLAVNEVAWHEPALPGEVTSPNFTGLRHRRRECSERLVRITVGTAYDRKPADAGRARHDGRFAVRFILADDRAVPREAAGGGGQANSLRTGRPSGRVVMTAGLEWFQPGWHLRENDAVCFGSRRRSRERTRTPRAACLRGPLGPGLNGPVCRCLTIPAGLDGLRRRRRDRFRSYTSAGLLCFRSRG